MTRGKKGRKNKEDKLGKGKEGRKKKLVKFPFFKSKLNFRKILPTLT